MKAILPNKSIIGGYLKPIHTISSCNPICKPKKQLNAALMQRKRNLKLYALTFMQTNNRNENIETTLPSCLNKALLFNVKKT